VSFDSPDKYFSENTHEEAIAYLQLANELIREIKPCAITVAEDMSGMPGMCLPIKDGGVGFDYRLGMGFPDLWIKLARERSCLRWDMEKIWSEMVLRRKGEKTVSYVECHDQALVGDQTMMFRLAGSKMYTDMSAEIHNRVIDRAIALHKMTRLLTAAAGGEGYLNFMGNEFGHPEWIDFPRKENKYSYQYCRRQWSLRDNPFLKYKRLGEFDEDMIDILRSDEIFDQFLPSLARLDDEQKILAFTRGDYLFVFNFHPFFSHEMLTVPVKGKASYKSVLCTDDDKYGGSNRVSPTVYVPKKENGRDCVEIAIPTQTAIVFKMEPKK
jgi:1,4-alpha-glucan branching enzyme